MRVLCCGDRRWTSRFKDEAHTMLDKPRNNREWDAIKRELGALPVGSVIIHANNNGAEKACAIIAKRLELKDMRIEPKWGLHGKQAGPLNNEKLLRDGKPQQVLVFHDDYLHDKGVFALVQLAREHNIPVRIITD